MLAAVPPEAVASSPGTAFVTCPERIDQINIRVFGIPNESEDWTFSDTEGVMGFAPTTTGPFVQPFTVTVAYDNAGMGLAALAMRASDSPLSTEGHTTLEATDFDDETLEFPMFIEQIEEVNLTQLDDTALEANPGPSGGVRFFPDGETPGAAGTRTIKVTATTRYGTPGLTVLFDGWDVDDPSDGDRDGDADPVDNSGNGEARLSSRSALTNAQGEATIQFDTPRFAGDNFRLFAACGLQYLFSIRPDGTDVQDPQGDVLPQPGAAVADMLTIWRRLHVEADTMQAVDGNQITGKVGSVVNQAGGSGPESFVDLRMTRKTTSPRAKRVSLSRHYDGNAFEGGSVEIGGVRYTVIGNSGATLLVAGTVPTSASGSAAVLVDDDNLGGGTLDGDEGDAVPSPDTSLFEATLEKAYITPVLSTGGTAPFEDFDTDNGRVDMVDSYAFDGQSLKSRSSWVVYQLGAYEFFREYDFDPGTDAEARLGQTDLTAGNSLGTMVFAETIRDFGSVEAKCQRAGVAIHELFHLLSITGHVADGLMKAGCTGGTGLSAESLQQVRGLLIPGQPLATFPNQTAPPAPASTALRTAAAVTGMGVQGGIAAG